MGRARVGGGRGSGKGGRPPLVYVVTATGAASPIRPRPGEVGPLAVKETVLRTQSPRSQQAPPGKTTSWLLRHRQAL